MELCLHGRHETSETCLGKGWKTTQINTRPLTERALKYPIEEKNYAYSEVELANTLRAVHVPVI